MFKNNEADMNVEYKMFKQGLSTHAGVTDYDTLYHYIDKVQKSTGFMKGLGVLMMVLGVPLLLVGIGVVLIPIGFITRKYGVKQVEKYEYFKKLAKADTELNRVA